MTIQKAPEQEFIERIEGLDAGQLAMLRRGCGERDPVEGRCPWLLRFIYGVPSESTAFLVASLLAQYKTADIKAGRHSTDGNFGESWKQAIQRTRSESESIRRRFHILLDADYEPRSGDGDLPYRLRQMVRYAAGKGVGVNWPALLSDLNFWNHTEKHVQKRWARSFFADEHQEGKPQSRQKE